MKTWSMELENEFLYETSRNTWGKSFTFEILKLTHQRPLNGRNTFDFLIIYMKFVYFPV